MFFNSFEFLWLFPLVFAAYYLVLALCKPERKSSRWDNYLLIAISYALYIKWNPAFALLLLGVTLVTWGMAFLIERHEAYGCKKWIIASGVLLSLLPLLFFKYYHFISDNLNLLLGACGIDSGLPGLNYAVPIGISFFSLQAVGYLWDVYYQRIKAEHNWWNYMLFVSFFPQIASGPISKANDLLPQINAQRTFSETGVIQGCKWLLWGMFLKVVLADRLGLYVDIVYSNYDMQTGLTCLLASIFYSFQIYGDFAGYSLMAIGVGKIMGFDLINNFNRPYFSKSITEFWRRWHISLSTWLKDYIYIPLGGSRCSKLRNYWNITVTFLVSGIWHGANWTFIVWGLLHGIYQIVEKMLGVQKSEAKGLLKFGRIVFTFLLVNFAWIFFRSPSLSFACDYIRKIFVEPGSSIYWGFSTTNVLIIASLATVLIKEIVEELSSFTLINSRYVIVRWATYMVIVFSILLFGVLDSSQFIYASF